MNQYLSALRLPDSKSGWALALGTPIAFAILISSLTKKRMHLPDGKPLPVGDGWVPLLGNILDLAKYGDQFYDYTTRNTLKHNGQPWLLDIPGQFPTVVLTSPEHMEDLFHKMSDFFERGKFTIANTSDFLGRGILCVDGDDWYFQRKSVSHLFSLQMMKDVMHDVIREKTQLAANAVQTYIDRKEAFSLRTLLTALTCDVFVEIGLNIDLDCIGNMLKGNNSNDFIDTYSSISARCRERTAIPHYIWKLQRFLNIGPERTLKENRRKLNDFFLTVFNKTVKQREEGKQNASKDLISMILDSEVRSPKTGESIQADSGLIRDMVINFIFAGKDTTSVSMAWFFVNLNRHPQVLSKLRHELKTHLPHVLGSNGAIPTMDEVMNVTYLEAVINENLRLYPSLPIDSRAPTCDVTLSDGTFLTDPCQIAVNIYGTGRLPSVWGKDAEEFKPERWIDSAGELKKVAPSKFPAFAHGKHKCIGQRFAMMELKIALAVLVSRFDLKTVEDPNDITYEMGITLSVKGDLMVNPSLVEG